MDGIIIGAGIGGLTTAIALKLKGFKIDLYEASEALSPIGAGILIPPNAMAVLDQYQLADHVERLGHTIHSLCILSHQGMPMSNNSASYKNNGVQYHTVAIHRGVLQAILLDQFGMKNIKLAHKCRTVKNTVAGVEVEFDNGDDRKAEFLIGADGINSTVRQSIMPNSVLRDTKQRCWRGVANIDLSEEWKNQLTELWGYGSRFGFVQIAPQQVYWYATIHQNDKNFQHNPATSEHLSQFYRDYINPVVDIIKNTEVKNIIVNDIYDLKPLTCWYRNATVLIGDAAHATTPNLGQGGAQAIEDSYTLAEQLSAYHHDLPKAFEQFQLTRMPRVNRIVKASWQVGKVSNISHPWLCIARNTLLRRVASLASARQSTMLYQWS